MIYADYNATGPVLPEVREAMAPWLESQFGNSASVHYALGQRAAAATSRAREQVAELLVCDPSEVVFTSGGTESCFLALLGAIIASPDFGEIAISAGEHAAVREAAAFLCHSPFRAQLKELPLTAGGDLFPEGLTKNISDKTAVVSVMAANNETGVYFNLEKLGGICKAQGVTLHTDAVQVIGRELFNAAAHPAQLISLSGHKFGAPKGVGALIVKSVAHWKSPMPGGGQEGGRRGGTVPVAQVVGLGAAAAVAFRKLKEDRLTQTKNIRDTFETFLIELLPQARILGVDCKRLANTSSVLIPGSIALDLVRRLGEREICISAGSACSVSHPEPSLVLRALGLSPFDALATVRVSFGTMSTADDAHIVARALAEELSAQREQAKVRIWEKAVPTRVPS